MKILILGLNYAPEKVGIAVYTTGMAEYLAERGHEVRVVAGKPYYPAWKIMDGHAAWGWSKKLENGVRVTRVPHYIPREPSGIKRLLHHFSFALSSFLPALWSGLTWRPDVVFTVAPSLIAAPVGKLAALFGGAKSWLHVQDFEVEAAFATGLLRDGNATGRLARNFENSVLKLFDTVSTISPQMRRKLAEKGVGQKRIVEFRNWTDIDSIQPMTEPSPYRAEWNISTPHVALYSGNIANKQGIEIVVEAAEMLKDRNDLTFVVCGEGPNRKRLERQAKGLTNIQFHDLQPKQRLNELMGLATIHLLPQKMNAADLVLPSKLTNMLASGRPVVATAADGTGLAEEVVRRGLVTPPGDVKAFVTAISTLIADSDLRSRAGNAARAYAEDTLGNLVVLRKLEAALCRAPEQ